MADVTRIDLFRSGNASSAQLSRPRVDLPNPDLEIFLVSSVVWVRAGTGGVSTWERPSPTWRGRTWRLPAGVPIPDELVVTNDMPGHWLWEPSRDMPLAQYVSALESVNAHFIRV